MFISSPHAAQGLAIAVRTFRVAECFFGIDPSASWARIRARNEPIAAGTIGRQRPYIGLSRMRQTPRITNTPRANSNPLDIGRQVSSRDRELWVG